MGSPSLPVRVLMDAGPAVHQRAGLRRYTERLAATLRARHSEIDLDLVYNAHAGHTLPAALAQGRSYTLPAGQHVWRLSVLASQVLRQSYVPLDRLLAGRAGAPTVYHATEHLLPCVCAPTVLTVHDLIFERYPQHHTRLNRAFLRAAMPRFVRAATQVIAVSRQTAHDLVALYGADRERVAVVYQGVESAFRPQPAVAVAAAQHRYSGVRPYLLMVGTLEPRKNHVLALEALARLKAAGHAHRLVIAGGRGWLFDPVERMIGELGLTGDVTFSGFVPEGDLPALYAGSDCLLMPSLYEGFGLPVLEAMACGTPVVCANASSLPEVADAAALLAPASDAEAFSAAIDLVLRQPRLAAALRTRGLERAAHFTWEACAAATVEVYRTAAAQ